MTADRKRKPKPSKIRHLPSVLQLLGLLGIVVLVFVIEPFAGFAVLALLFIAVGRWLEPRPPVVTPAKEPRRAR